MRPRDTVIVVGRRILSALVFVCLAAGATIAADVRITSVRHWTAPDHTRVVLDLSGPADYAVRRVDDPARIAVTIPGAAFGSLETVAVADDLVLRVRRNALEGRAQAVLDLAGDVEFRHFALRAGDGRPDRIVVDVSRPSPTAASVPDTTEGVVVVIDPGHGGMDPGAVRDGVREKDVVLGIARRLEVRLEARDGFSAVLTREGDWFVSLADRVGTARRAGGDLFVSIHANSNDRSALSGMEVYFLSRQRADDRETQELADRENAADLVGLPPDERLDGNVLEILMDLRSSSVLTGSNRLADRILGAARRSGEVKARGVRQDVFRVLQTLAMPSALVETAYLSNPGDRELLATRSGQDRLAAILAEGIFAYLDDRDPTLWEEPGWSTRYRVRRGDTLWALARRYSTSVDEIRRHNELSDDRLRVGQTLTLP